MNVKQPLIIAGALLIVLELLCFMLSLGAVPPPEPDPVLSNMEYIPYMLVAMTLSFVAFFILLFSLIVFILRGNLKNKVLALALLSIAFVLPIALYAVLF
jgi:hypothetical protein